MEKFFNNTNATLSKIQREFDDYQKEFFLDRTPQFFCLELNGEAGELANLEKKIWKGKDINIDALSDEAADVFIALMNYSNSRNINLGESVCKKLKWIDNKMRQLKEIGEDY